MQFGFPTTEKLKSKTLIKLLFTNGNSVSKYPLKLIYTPATLPHPVPVQAAVSVSKRNFKSAVKRNRIKRLLREAYRLEKPQLTPQLTEQYVFMFLYTGKDMPDYNLIQHKMKGLLEKFIQNEINKR